MKEFIKSTLAKFAGKEKNQKMYAALYRIALNGMNYGNGGNFRESGELNLFKFLNGHLQKDYPLIIFDVGASVGNYAKALADFFQDGKVFVFEPSRNTYSTLVENIQGYRNIKANNIGFSDHSGPVTLYMDQELSGLASVYNRNLDHHGIKIQKREEIILTTIDEFCEQEQISRINFLKLDIEGHELCALKGAGNMISNGAIDFIQFEFGGCNIDSRTYFRDFFYLLNQQFKIFRIVKDGLFEVKRYSESEEIFMTINYLAVRRDRS